ncbi:M48 family metalloprotease [Undibacterium jejuense]|uniref:M48 family metalloprotease n=1 Tax=Undibacterium jejuense TaxID=1344949 RepID=A0A923HNI7_9BURK|nr:M48 family metalloprotease [Undibacterium jejuense]MBC3864214.1 M48 family metalloprotease [Undibacterium jejuense]
MFIRHLLTVGLFSFCVSLIPGYAQVPETGRWQELAYSTAAVNAETADRYHEHIDALRSHKQLDQDPALLSRIKTIARGLISAASKLKPESNTWRWEIHITSEQQVDAYCMAGGKILIGSEFVRRLKLSNSELATLLGHEMAHAIAEHHREELSEALHINAQPGDTLDVMMGRLETDISMQLKLATLSNIQESEADQLGMILAHMAGWDSASMVSFFQKLQRVEANSVPNNSYPSTESRLSMARGFNKLWAKIESDQKSIVTRRSSATNDQK